MKISKIVLPIFMLIFSSAILTGCSSNTQRKHKTVQLESSRNHYSKKVKPQIQWKHVKEDPNLPILMYHSISPSTNSLRIPASQFKQQMKWLRQKNYVTLTPAEAARVILKHEVPNRPYVWITLDDGYEDNYRQAFPILKKYNLNATINFITSFSKRKGHLTTAQAKEMIKSGNISIESHTVKHRDLDILSKDEQTTELTQSKKWLDQTFNQNTSVICYPAGRINDATAETAKRAGYTLGITTQPGLANISQGQFDLERVRMVPGMTQSTFFNLIQNGK